jgi:hypothetical protein
VAHVPVPVQWETGVAVVPVHEGAPQLVPAPACSQAPAPLQLPVLPQGGLAAQRACGSASPEPTFEQVPALPTTLQAAQVPHTPLLQQTPSTQKLPVRQSPVAVHGCPRRFLSPHRLVLGSQMLGARQSVSAVHAALQAAIDVALHRKGAQAIVDAAWQLPTPSQVRGCVSVEPLVGHDGGTHWVPAA